MSEAKITLTAEDVTGPAVASARRNLASLATQTDISAKQMAASMRMVPAQVTDIVTQLAGGAKPLTVLIQQGGQLKDMFGGVVPAAKALGGYLLSLANPMTIVAGAAGALFVAFQQGADESRELNKVLIMTGNYAGQTASSLNEMAKSVAAGAKVTRGQAAEALIEVVGTGKIAASQLQSASQTALQWSKVTGDSIKSVVDKFVQLGQEPAAASAKLNEQYHYLTASVYEQIRALEEEGRKEQAAALAQKALTDAGAERSKKVIENLGYVERALNAVWGAAKGAWSAVADLGRDPTRDEQLAKLLKTQQQRATWAKAHPDQVDDSWRLGEARLKTQIDLLQQVGKAEADTAKQAGETQRANDAAISATSRVSALEDQAKGIAAVDRELKKFRDDLAAIRAVNPDSPLLKPAAIKAGEQAIRDAHAGPEFGIDARVKKLQGQLEQEERALRAQQDQIKADYDVGLLTTKQYLDKDYEAKQSALEREMAIVRKQEELARGKKNTAAVEQYKNEEKKILDQIEQNFVHHANAVTEQAAKAQRAVAAYAESLSAQTRARQMAIDDSLAGAGLSDRAKQEQQNLTAVRRDFEQKREDLFRQRQKGEASGGISEDVYRRELADLQAYYQGRLAQEQDYNAKSQAQREDWRLGASKAFAEYAESARDAAAQSARFFGNVMQTMEDALVQFATTGKLNFRSLANSIISDIVRIQAKAIVTKMFGPGSVGGGLLQQLGASIFGGAGGGAAAIDAGSMPIGFTMAAKGNVFQTPGLSAHSNRIVNRPTLFAFSHGAGLMGEAGPEAIMPLRRGRDGRLGVDAGGAGAGAGTGGDMKLTIINNTSAPIGKVHERRISANERALIIEEARKTTVAALSNANSPESKALASNFGLGRKR